MQTTSDAFHGPGVPSGRPRRAWRWIAGALLLALGATAFASYRYGVDADGWREARSERSTRAARAAARRLDGASRASVLDLLGRPDLDTETVLTYELGEGCGATLLLDACFLELHLDRSRVVGAVLVDSGAAPGTGNETLF